MGISGLAKEIQDGAEGRGDGEGAADGGRSNKNVLGVTFVLKSEKGQVFGLAAKPVRTSASHILEC